MAGSICWNPYRLFSPIIRRYVQMFGEANERQCPHSGPGAHIALGYASWPAYLADVLGETPLRLERDVRQELVAELTAQGMSTRAIAPIVGASVAQVKRDAGGSFGPPARRGNEHTDEQWADYAAAMNVDQATGEIIDAEIVEIPRSTRPS